MTIRKDLQARLIVEHSYVARQACAAVAHHVGAIAEELNRAMASASLRRMNVEERAVPVHALDSEFHWS